MIRYVVGFAFNEARKRVVLIRKNRPTWQAGLWNGTGGHVEAGESGRAAMAREFKEETGLTTSPFDWEQFASMNGPNWECQCFRAFLPSIEAAQTMEDEEVFVHDVFWYPIASGVKNLQWLVELALDEEHRGASIYYA